MVDKWTELADRSRAVYLELFKLEALADELGMLRHDCRTLKRAGNQVEKFRELAKYHSVLRHGVDESVWKYRETDK